MLIHIRIIPLNARKQIYLVTLNHGKFVLKRRHCPSRLALTQALFIFTRDPVFAHAKQAPPSPPQSSGHRTEGKTVSEWAKKKDTSRKQKLIQHEVRMQRAQDRALGTPSGFLKEKTRTRT